MSIPVNPLARPSFYLINFHQEINEGLGQLGAVVDLAANLPLEEAQESLRAEHLSKLRQVLTTVRQYAMSHPELLELGLGQAKVSCMEAKAFLRHQRYRQPEQRLLNQLAIARLKALEVHLELAGIYFQLRGAAVQPQVLQA